MSFDFKPIRMAKLAPNIRWQIFGASQLSLSEKEGQDGLDYLVSTRKIDIGTIAKFRFGYCPKHIDHPFAGRIVMPIYDAYDDLLALSVRPITDNKDELKAAGKYWNESYEKGAHLYGMNIAKYSMIKMGFAILVEGQLDVAAMHSFGFTNTVAVLGGAFTPLQAFLLRKFTDQLVLLFDGDKAGNAHTQRAIDVLKQMTFQNSSKYAKRSSVLKYTVAAIHGKADQNSEKNKMDPNDFLAAYGSYPMKKILAESMLASNLTLPTDWKFSNERTDRSSVSVS